MVNWFTGSNLPALELERSVIQDMAHASFSPGLCDFVQWTFGALFLHLRIYCVKKFQPEFQHFLLDLLCNLSDSVCSPVKWGGGDERASGEQQEIIM